MQFVHSLIGQIFLEQLLCSGTRSGNEIWWLPKNANPAGKTDVSRESHMGNVLQNGHLVAV